MARRTVGEWTLVQVFDDETARSRLARAATALVVLVLTALVPPTVERARADVVLGNFPTTDGLFAGLGVRPAGSVTEVQVAGRGGVAADAAAVVLSVTATEPSGSGFVTVYPCDVARPNASNLNFSIGSTVATSVIAKLAPAGTLCVFVSNTVHLVIDVSGWFPPDEEFEPSQPGRVLDTRPGAQTIDGVAAGGGAVAAGSVTELIVGGRAGVERYASAVVLNVIVTNAGGPGFVTVYPCDAGRPLASNLNYPSASATSSAVATAVVAAVDPTGAVCLYSSNSTHLVADVNGWFRAGSEFRTSQPSRLLDTRPGGLTVDGLAAAEGVRAAGSVTKVVVSGRGGVPANAQAAVLNLTVAGTHGAGFLSVYPCDQPRAATSNLNHATATTTSSSVIAKLDPSGTVCVFNSTGTHLIVDVGGSFPSTAGFRPLAPARLLDSRLVDAPGSDDSALPAFSGSGRRVVYSKDRMRVWKVDDGGGLLETYRVSGRMDQPRPGTYAVFSKSARTCSNASPDICMRFMVRFALSFRGDNIGFHEIPVRRGIPLQDEDQLGQALSGGCIRQATADAIRMWEWADIGTTVVVVD